jgi:hypothetical protein
LGLPSLPSPEELEKLQEQRRLEIVKKLEKEKQMALKMQAQNSPSPSRRPGASGRGGGGGGGGLKPVSSSTSIGHNNGEQVSPNTGWGPELEGRQPSRNSADLVDPMLLQINRVKKYIRQARDDHRYDEVQMLEANLRELEIEFYVQQQEEENSGHPSGCQNNHEDGRERS